MCFRLQTESADTSACPSAEPTEGSFQSCAGFLSLPWVDITTILKQEEPGGSCLLTLTRFPPSAGRLEVALADARLHNTVSLKNVLLPEMVALAPNKHLKLSLRRQASLGFALEPSQRLWQCQPWDWRPLRMELMASPERIRKLQLNRVLFTQGLLCRWVALKCLFGANCRRSKVSAERKSKLGGAAVSAWQSRPRGEGRKTPGPVLPHRAQAWRILSDAGHKVFLTRMLK